MHALYANPTLYFPSVHVARHLLLAFSPLHNYFLTMILRGSLFFLRCFSHRISYVKMILELGFPAPDLLLLSPLPRLPTLNP